MIIGTESGGIAAGGGAGRRRPGRAARRGVTLTESILYLAVMFSVVTYTAQALMTENRRQDERLVAAELRQFVGSAQGYVAAQYPTILQMLLEASVPDDPNAPVNPADLVFPGATNDPGNPVEDVSEMLAMTITMSEVSRAGYLPGMYAEGLGALRQTYKQDFALVARAVRRSDTADVKPTLRRAQVLAAGADPNDPDAPFDPLLIDGIYNIDSGGPNDEIDLEVLLVSRRADGVAQSEAKTIPETSGLRIVRDSEIISAGFITREDPGNPMSPTEAVGPYGSWRMSTEGFERAGLLSRSGEGHLAAVVALSGYRVIRSDPERMVEDAVAVSNLSRCKDTLPAEVHASCMADLESSLYRSIVFNSYDGVPDDDSVAHTEFPGIVGVGSIAMSTERDAPASITEVRSIAMSDQADAPASITEVRSIDMAGGPAPTAQPGTGTGAAAATAATAPGDGTNLPGGLIRNVMGISCLANGDSPVDPVKHRLTIACPETRITGTLIVEKDADGAGGNLEVAGRLKLGGVEADRVIVMESETVSLDISNDRSRSTRVPMPTCATGFRAEIVWTPVEFVAPEMKNKKDILNADTVKLKTVASTDDVVTGEVIGPNTTGRSSVVGVRPSTEKSSSAWKPTLSLLVRHWYNTHVVDEVAPASATIWYQTMCVRTGV